MNEEAKMDQLCEHFLQTVHQFGQLEKEMHIYGTKQKLHLSETHTIVDIGNNDCINITKLAKLQGISKSAASQMVSRLVKKGFIRRELSPKTENEVVLSLTESGEKICKWHEKQHIWLRKRLSSILADYPNDTIAQLQSLMTSLQSLWETIPEQVK
ncbi:MAG TPA: MarR family transcriptional regulator [Clostridiales bacterium]|nr:MarR family transcriptional regulator [Clostridiales bacterium]